MASVEESVRDRLGSDPAVASLVGDRIYPGEVPPHDAAPPWLFFEVPDVEPVEGLADAGSEAWYTVEVHGFDHTRAGVVALAEALYASLGAYAGGQVRRSLWQGTRYEAVEEGHHCVVTFRVHGTNAAIVPVESGVPRVEVRADGLYFGGVLMGGGGAPGVTDHAALSNLAYAASGHTGFAGTAVANTFLAPQTVRPNGLATDHQVVIDYQDGGSFRAEFPAVGSSPTTRLLVSQEEGAELATGTNSIQVTGGLVQFTAASALTLTAAAGVVVTGTGAAVVRLAVQAAAGQTADVLQLQDSTGSWRVAIDPTAPTASESDPWFFALRPGSREYRIGTRDAGGVFVFARSDAAASLGVMLDNAQVGFRVNTGSVPLYVLGNTSTGIVLTPTEGGGTGVLQVGRRLSDSSPGVGASVEVWTHTGQTAPAVTVQTPGGAGSAYKVTPAGDVELWADSSTANRIRAEVRHAWATSTDASRAGRLTLAAYSTTTAQEGVRVEGNAGGVRLGFYGGGAVAKPTVTGSRGGNAALASLLTGLAALGLITDSTS